MNEHALEPSKSPSRKHLAKKAIHYYEQLKEWHDYDQKKSPQVTTDKKNSISRSRSTITATLPHAPSEEIYVDEQHRKKHMEELKCLMKKELGKAEHDGALDFSRQEIAKAYTGYPEFMRRESPYSSTNQGHKPHGLEDIHTNTHVIKPLIEELKEAVVEASHIYEGDKDSLNHDDSYLGREYTKIHPSNTKAGGGQQSDKLFPLELKHANEYNESPYKSRFDHHQRMAKEIRRLQYASEISSHNRSRSTINSQRPSGPLRDTVKDALVQRAPPRIPPASLSIDYCRKEKEKPIIVLRVDTSKELRVVFRPSGPTRDDEEEIDRNKASQGMVEQIEPSPFRYTPEYDDTSKEVKELRHKPIINRTPAPQSQPDDIVGQRPTPIRMNITLTQEMPPAYEDKNDYALNNMKSRDREVISSPELDNEIDSPMHSNYQEKSDHPMTYRTQSVRSSLIPPSEPDLDSEVDKVRPHQLQEKRKSLTLIFDKTTIDKPTHSIPVLRPSELFSKLLEQGVFITRIPLSHRIQPFSGIISKKLEKCYAHKIYQQPKIQSLHFEQWSKSIEMTYFHKPAKEDKKEPFKPKLSSPFSKNTQQPTPPPFVPKGPIILPKIMPKLIPSPEFIKNPLESCYVHNVQARPLVSPITSPLLFKHLDYASLTLPSKSQPKLFSQPKPADKPKIVHFQATKPFKPVPLSPQKSLPKPSPNITDSPVLSPSPENYSQNMSYTYIHKIHNSHRLNPSPDRYSLKTETMYARINKPVIPSLNQSRQEEYSYAYKVYERPSIHSSPESSRYEEKHMQYLPYKDRDDDHYLFEKPQEKIRVHPKLIEIKEETTYINNPLWKLSHNNQDEVDAISAQHSDNSSVLEEDMRGDLDDHPTEHDSHMSVPAVPQFLIYPPQADARSLNQENTTGEPLRSFHSIDELSLEPMIPNNRTDPIHKFPVWIIAPHEPIPCLLSSPDGFSIDTDSGKLEIKNGDRVVLESAEYGRLPKITDVVRAPTEDLQGKCDFFVKSSDGKAYPVVVMLREISNKNVTNCSLYDPEQKKVGRALFKLVNKESSNKVPTYFYNGILLEDTGKVSEVLVKRSHDSFVIVKRGPQNITKQKVKSENSSNLQGTPVSILTVETPIPIGNTSKGKKTELVIFAKKEYKPFKSKLLEGEMGKAECEDGQSFEGPLLLEGLNDPEVFLLIPPSQRSTQNTPKYVVIDFDTNTEHKELQQLKEKVLELAKGRRDSRRNPTYYPGGDSKNKENRDKSNPNDSKMKSTKKDKLTPALSQQSAIHRNSRPNDINYQKLIKDPIKNSAPEESWKELESASQQDNLFHQHSPPDISPPAVSHKEVKLAKTDQSTVTNNPIKKYSSATSESIKNTQTAKTLPSSGHTTGALPTPMQSVFHMGLMSNNLTPTRSKYNSTLSPAPSAHTHQHNDKSKNTSSGHTPEKTLQVLGQKSATSSLHSPLESQARLQVDLGHKGSMMHFEGIGKMLVPEVSLRDKSTVCYSDQLKYLKEKAARAILDFWRYSKMRQSVRAKAELKYLPARKMLMSRSQYRKFLLHHTSLPGTISVEKALKSYLKLGNKV